MSKKMYHIEGPCPDNEALALRLQDGDELAATMLLSQNENYLTSVARRLRRQCKNSGILEDLKQEGALALLDAARRYRYDSGAKFLTYAAKAVFSAMFDCLAKTSLPADLPRDRYRSIRRVAFLISERKFDCSESDLLQAICDELKVSQKVARTLLADYRALFQYEYLEDAEEDIAWGDDPATILDRSERKRLAVKLLDEVLTPRERNVVIYHLGIGMTEEMTFQELSIRLNYNDPSAAQKVYDRAIKKLHEHLYGSELGVWLHANAALREALRRPESGGAVTRREPC